jgi:hypothetical protein
MSFVEENGSGFNTVGEAHPSEIVPNGVSEITTSSQLTLTN